MKKFDSDTFKRHLDEEHQWPCDYIFKFIVPKDQVVALEHIVALDHTKLRPSKNGKYISVTFQLQMKSSDEVMGVYQKASKIPGIISL